MQSISRFLAVLIALIFLIGPLAGTAAAHETEDGDHEGADYGSLTLMRQDGLGGSVHVGQTMQFGWEFAPSSDHPLPGPTTVTLMGVAKPTVQKLSDSGRTIDYLIVTDDLGGGTSRTFTIYLETNTYTPDGDANSDVTGIQKHGVSTPVKSSKITVTVLPKLSDVVTLAKLELSDITLDPAFVADSKPNDKIEASVAYKVAETTVTAETTHTGATTKVTVGDDLYTGAVPLKAGGDTAIVVTVTAEDGTTDTYTVTVSRIGEPIMDGVEVAFMATVPEGDDFAVNKEDDSRVTFAVTMSTGVHSIEKGPEYTITVTRYRGDFVISENVIIDSGGKLPQLGSNAKDAITPVPYQLTAAEVSTDGVDRIEFEFKTTFIDDTFGFTGTAPDSEATRYEGRPIPLKSGETSGTTTPSTTPSTTPTTTPAPAAAPAASGPPLGEIGRTGSATATVLAGDVLQVVRHDGGATLNIGIGWIATNDSSQVLVGFIRDEGLGQTYAIVRRQDDGKVVRRWVEPDSADVFVVPWADVLANYTVPTDVIISIPLDDRHAAQLMLARRFDGGDDRIFVHIGYGVWSHVPDYATFLARGFEWQNVTAADSDFFNRINIGTALPSSGG